MSSADGDGDGVVFLFDVDDTLLDNDAVIADLRLHLEATLGSALAARYWAVFGQQRDALGYVDYLGAFQPLRQEIDGASELHRKLLQASAFLIDYPFADRLYPHALEVVARLGEAGTTAILSDGDVVLQPRKIVRSGLWDAVHGRVLVDIHKEQALDAMARALPARRYVMFDDKLRLLSAMKTTMGERLVTVFVRQGHYAHDADTLARYSHADFTVDTIADLLAIDLDVLRRAPLGTPLPELT